MSPVTLLLIISVLLFFYKLLSPGGKIKSYGEKIPGPKTYPIIGNGLCFFTKKPVLQVFYDLSATYGSVFRLWIGKQLFIMLSDPADVEIFLTSTNKHLDKSDSYRFLDSWLGDTNLLTSDGDIWQTHRKQLTPSFHFKMLENSVGMITKNAEILVDQLRKKLDQLDFDIEPYIEKCTLDILCETAMGTKLQTQLSKNILYLDCIKTVSKILVKRILYPWLHPELAFKVSTNGRLYYKNLKIIKAEGGKIFCTHIKRLTFELKPAMLKCIIHSLTNMIVNRATTFWLHPEILYRFTSRGKSYYKKLQSTKCFVLKVIQQRKKILEQTENMSSMPEEEGRKISQPFLDFLLTRSSFSDTEIENEVQTFMFAGHDTTKTTISFCLYSLSQNEDVQNKLYEEINANFIDTEGNPSYQDYVNMKYLECVIKETMRLYATVPVISRKVSQDVQLPSGYKIPAGALVNIFIFGMHRNKHLHTDPEKFSPERFETRDNSQNPFSYLPFSAGPRNCIGQKFAMIEMKIVLCKLLLQYKFLPTMKTKPLILDTSMVIRSLHQLPVRIKQRSLKNI